MLNPKDCLAPGDIVVVYVGSCPVKMVQIKDIVIDENAKNRTCWIVTFIANDLPFEWSWFLNDEHIHQEEFTMNRIPHRLQLFAKTEQVTTKENKLETKMTEALGDEF